MSGEIREIDRKSLQNIAYISAASVAILFGLLLPWLLGWNWHVAPWIIAIVIFTFGLLAPNTLRPCYRIWIRCCFVLNVFATQIIPVIVFFVAILPTGLLYRLRGNDPLHRKWEDQLSTYRFKSDKKSSRHMEKPF